MQANSRNVLIALASVLLTLSALRAQTHAGDPNSATLEGTVRDASGQPVPDAYVRLGQKGNARFFQTKTDIRGNFVFSSLPAGRYVARAEQSGTSSEEKPALVSSGATEHLDLVLPAANLHSRQGPSAAPAIELDNKTNFEVAGVTDWTAAGGHGSDTNLRTSESLASDTRALRDSRPDSASSSAAVSSVPEPQLRSALAVHPRDFELNHQLGEIYFRSGRSRDAIPLFEAAYRANPSDFSNGYDLALAYQAAGELRAARNQAGRMLGQAENADLRRLLGDIDEQMQDSLAAVREYERAAHIDPSEVNYFAWAVELLVHRAVQPAIEVFSDGSRKYPGSERMLEGLGAALYASGSYPQAAEKLCAASDLNPQDHSPYVFLAGMEQAAPQPLACAEEKLRRFVENEPENAMANYDYAVALRKREQGAGKVATSNQIQSLLEKAIRLDQHFAAAHLELGVLYAAREDFESAIIEFQKALVENADLTEAHFRLGQAYKRRGEEDKARQQFQAYEHNRKTEAAAIDARRREVRQFVIVLKQQPQRPATVEP